MNFILEHFIYYYTHLVHTSTFITTAFEPLSDSADGTWLVSLTKLDVDVACLVHAVGGSQDDVFIEDGSSAEPDVLLVQEESL